MAEPEGNRNGEKPHLATETGTTGAGIGATLVASSDGAALHGRDEQRGLAADTIGPGAMDRPLATPPGNHPREPALGARHASSEPSYDRSAAYRHGVIRQAAEAGRGAMTQIADEFRSAAEGLFDEQKTRAAESIRGIADVLHHSAQEFEEENLPVAHFADSAARRIESFSDELHRRSWGELIADAEMVARRQPGIFLLGAAALGFAAGRLMMATPRETRLSEYRDPQSGRADSPIYQAAEPTTYGAASATTATGASMRDQGSLR